MHWSRRYIAISGLLTLCVLLIIGTAQHFGALPFGSGAGSVHEEQVAGVSINNEEGAPPDAGGTGGGPGASGQRAAPNGQPAAGGDNAGNHVPSCPGGNPDGTARCHARL